MAKPDPRQDAPDYDEAEHLDTDLSHDEKQDVEEKQMPRAVILHEVIREQGEHELERTVSALWWSALAAGFTMGLSLMAMGLFNAHMAGVAQGAVLSSLGYSAGFVAVILARQQLFTENTITAVLPVISNPSWRMLWRLLRLWGVVLLGNLCGTALVALAMLKLPIFDAPTDHAFLEIGRHVMENSVGQMIAKGIISGWMIAIMVWMLPAADGAKVWIIIAVTYLMALGSFTHIVVGSLEVSYLVWAGEETWWRFFGHFAGPTLLGNIIGGSLIFTLISHAQVRSE